MYVGHLAVALAAARTRRNAPIWALLIASQFPDWIQLGLEAIGAYSAQLYSHSLVAVLIGALLFTLLFLRQTGDWQSAQAIAVVYLSHPLLDLVTGYKPLWSGGPALGANLYDHPVLDFGVESLIAVAGWLAYRSARRTRPAAPIFAIIAILIACQGLLDFGQHLRLLRNQMRASIHVMERTIERHRSRHDGISLSLSVVAFVICS